MKTCENSQLATPVNEEVKEVNYYDEEFVEDFCEYLIKNAPQAEKLRCANCRSHKEIAEILFFKRPHVHTICKQCVRNNYYWFEEKKDDEEYPCFYYGCRA